jgi:hypothetical protein
MTWFIYRGEDLLREQSVKFPFFRTLPEDYEDRQLIFEDELIRGEAKVPPVHPGLGLTATNCKLTADLRNVDRSQFPKKTGADGLQYVLVYYDLVVSIQTGAVMKFSCEIKGKEMGTVIAKYD